MNQNQGGVYWHDKHQRYQAQLHRDGRTLYLGEFGVDDKDLADAMLDEARHTPDDQIQDLKKKYRTLRAARHGQPPDALGINRNGHRPAPEPLTIPDRAAEAMATAIDPGYEDGIPEAANPPPEDSEAQLITLLRAALAAQRAASALKAAYETKLVEARQAWAAYDQAVRAAADPEVCCDR